MQKNLSIKESHEHFAHCTMCNSDVRGGSDIKEHFYLTNYSCNLCIRKRKTLHFSLHSVRTHQGKIRVFNLSLKNQGNLRR